MNPTDSIRALGAGLVLRTATPADLERLVEFNSRVHSDDGIDKPDRRVGAWTHDLLAKPHPTFQPGDFTIVEDTHTGQIVSSMNLISQTWTYAGIPLAVGRPELVGTWPEYRNRGLVRAQFDLVHQWSAARGELVQAITGIPYYYRLFGYEMALDLGGGRAGYIPQIPRLKEGEADPYRIRPAAEADLPFIAELYAQGRRRSLISCCRDEALWRYELNGKSFENVNRFELRIIETAAGEAAGFLSHPFFLWDMMLAAVTFELKSGLPWTTAAASVIRYLETEAHAIIAREGKGEFGSYGFWLGQDHPVYHAIPDRLPRLRRPYAWYLRVPDLPRFLLHIRPALEQRLVNSIASGFTGELKLTFYQDGLRLAFERGRLAQIEAWQPAPQGHSGDAAFPGLTFLQLLFGYRSLEELQAAFADCWTHGDDSQAVLQALFPKQVSEDLWPIS